MTLYINGTDFSDYVQQKTDIIETPRRVEGSGGGTSIEFETIYDEGVTKYDISLSLKPLPQTKMAALLKACETVPVPVIYDSVFGVRSIYARVTVNSFKYLTTSNGVKIYGESSITITER